MKVYVVGAGAVGRYLGELLRATGNEVVYAPRDLAAVEPYAADLAIVAVKAYDTDGAIETLRRALGAAPTAAIVTPQNGVGNEEKLAAAFGADAVVACALTVPVEMDRNGKPLASNGGGIAFAKRFTTDPVGATGALFEHGRVPGQIVMHDMATMTMKVNAFLTDGCANQHFR